MIRKPYRIAAQLVLVTVLTLSAAVACNQNQPDGGNNNTSSGGNSSSSSSTSGNGSSSGAFLCKQDNNTWATLPNVDGASGTPLITWNSREFGDNWTPKERCDHVSEKLAKTAKDNAGKLTDLNLTTGKVQGYTVVCVAKGSESCNSNNMLFTLNKKNAKNPSAVLAKITNYAKDPTSGNTITESGSLPSRIPLEALVNR